MLGHFKKDIIKGWRTKVGDAEADRVALLAKTRGKAIHKMVEKYLLNESIVDILKMPDMRQSFNDMKADLDRIDNIRHIECCLYSDDLKLAGRSDIIADFDGVLSIIDIKTSLRERPEDFLISYYEQMTGYSLMYEYLTGIKICNIVVIMLVDDLSRPQVEVRRIDDYVCSLKEKVLEYSNEQQRRNS